LYTTTITVVDENGGWWMDDGVIMPTMTTLTAIIQFLKLFLVYYEG
jgi:hypothetical protein